MKSHLSKEITLIIVVKLAIILLAGFTIFGKDYRVHVDTAKMSEQILPNTEANHVN